MQTRDATPQDLLDAWECDLWRLNHSPLKPDLVPLTAQELEVLVTRFPEVMPHIYVRSDAVLLGAAANARNLMEVSRRDLFSPGELPVQLYPRSSTDIRKWCGTRSTVDVLAFNPLRTRAIHQTLAARTRKS